MHLKFHLSIVPNYNKMIMKIFLHFIFVMIPIILFVILLENKVINPSSIKFNLILPLYIILVFILTFLMIRKTYFKGDVFLENNAMTISKIGEINFNNISKYKTFSFRGYSTYIITLQTGIKIAFGPSNNYSTSANKVFNEFKEAFETKLKIHKSNN